MIIRVVRIATTSELLDRFYLERRIEPVERSIYDPPFDPTVDVDQIPKRKPKRKRRR